MLTFVSQTCNNKRQAFGSLIWWKPERSLVLILILLIFISKMAPIIHCIQIELELIWELLVFGDRGINLTKQRREPTTNYASCRVRERNQNKLGTVKLESNSGALTKSPPTPPPWLLPLEYHFRWGFQHRYFLLHPIAFTAGVSQQRKEQFHHCFNLMLKPPQKQSNPLLSRYK